MPPDFYRVNLVQPPEAQAARVSSINEQAMRYMTLLSSWAFGDRIRASARDGKLLRLPVGACLRVGGILYQVTRRRRSSGEASVSYHCRGETDNLMLTVTLASDNRLRLHRFAGDDLSELEPHEVEVFG